MDTHDQRAIQAAYHGVTTITWMINNPNQPVPTDLLRPAMESFADYFVDELVTKLQQHLDQIAQPFENAAENAAKRDAPTDPD